MMRVRHCPDLQTYYDQAAPFLQQREAEHNMVLAMMRDTMRQASHEAAAHTYYGVVETDTGEIVAAASCDDDFLAVSHPAAGYEAAVELLLRDAVSSHIQELIVPHEFGSLVQALWQTHTSLTLVEDFAMHVYRLDAVRMPQGIRGAMTWTTAPQEDPQIRTWMKDFYVEAFGRDPADMSDEDVSRAFHRFQSNPLYRVAVWQVQGEAVSMAATVGQSPTGMRIGLVYTPPEQRGHGYASVLTAALSQWVLDQGFQFCTLNTDKTNPTSNKIYAAIGYYAVAEQIVYEVEHEESR